MSYIDPLGLKVFRCCRDVEVSPFIDTASRLFGLQHCFVKTDTLERGMGPADAGPLPTCPLGVPTAVVDHTGQSDDPGTTCVEIPDANETCVNSQLDLGRATGRWGPNNNCNTFADEVIQNCQPKCDKEPLPPPFTLSSK